MKNIITITIAAVVLVGCGESQQSSTTPEAQPAKPVAEATQPEPPTAKAPETSIHAAARDENIEAVKQHLAAGTDVNVKDKYGDTPLHKAALNGHKEIAELLIDKGADVNAIIVSGHLKGQTSLDFASVLKSTELADLLRKHGAKPGEELKSEEK